MTEALEQQWRERMQLAIHQLAEHDLICDVDYLYLRRQNVEKMAMQVPGATWPNLKLDLTSAVICAHQNVAQRCLLQLQTMRYGTQQDIEKLYLTCIAHYTWMDNQIFQRDGVRPELEKAEDRANMAWATAVETAVRLGLELAHFNEQMRILLDSEVETLVRVSNAMFGIPIHESRDDVMVVSALKSANDTPIDAPQIPKHHYAWITTAQAAAG